MTTATTKATNFTKMAADGDHREPFVFFVIFVVPIRYGRAMYR